MANPEPLSGGPVRTVDLTGVEPAALLGHLRRALADAPQGAVVRFVLDAPAVAEDVRAWARHTGREVSDLVCRGRLVWVDVRNGDPWTPYRVLVMRGAPRPRAWGSAHGPHGARRHPRRGREPLFLHPKPRRGPRARLLRHARAQPAPAAGPYSAW